MKARMVAADNAPRAARESPKDSPKACQTLSIPASDAAAAQFPAKTVDLEDPYAWLRGANWPNERVDEPPILDYLNAENAYCKDFLESLKTHQDQYFETLKGRIKLSDSTLPSLHSDGYEYYTRTEEALQYGIDCRRKAPAAGGEDSGAKEEVLLDRNLAAEGKKFSKILATKVSENGRVLAYKSDFVGDENYKLNVEHIGGESSSFPESGLLQQVSTYCFHELPVAQDSDGHAVGADPVGVFYSVRNAQLRPTQVWYHRFGAPVADDVLLFESKDDMFTVNVKKSTDGEFVLIDYHSSTENESLFLDARASVRAVEEAKAGTKLDVAAVFPLQLLRPLKPDVEYSADHGGGFWYLKTKEGCAKEHFRVLRRRDAETDLSVFLEEHPKVCMNSGVLLTKSFVGVAYLDTITGQCKLMVYAHGHDEKSVGSSGPTSAQVLFPGVDPEATSHDACFSGTSNYELDHINVAVDTPVSPTIWYRYPRLGAPASEMEVLKRKEVPNFDASLYATERVYVRYKEKVGDAVHESLREETLGEYAKGEVSARLETVTVPVTVLYRKEFRREDGSMPLLLNGYGSYGSCEEPVWSNLDTLYADLGFCVATAHIRGGGDLGEPWYLAAKFLSKKRTFLDFIAAAEHLSTPDPATGKHFSSPGNIALVGGSAGGMLVGACLNLRPDLFRSIVAHVPFVTVLDTMLDGELPLTPGEFKEWGNPRKDVCFFDYMRSYCPYENLRADQALLKNGKFPSVFATAGLSDYRVGYYECAKWVAKMRWQIQEAKRAAREDSKTIEEPLIVMETNMDAGHGGASGRFDRLKEVSRDVAFLALEFGKVEKRVA